MSINYFASEHIARFSTTTPQQGQPSLQIFPTNTAEPY